MREKGREGERERKQRGIFKREKEKWEMRGKVGKGEDRKGGERERESSKKH